MQRIFDDYAYGPGPRDGCWWDETCQIRERPALSDALKVDVVVIGAGFTGLNAARSLARQGVDVAVLEANRIGWGASGRNGGFCCLGGSKAGDAELDRRYGKDERLSYRSAEKAAVSHVENIISECRLDVDRHSEGETGLAHSPGAMAGIAASVRRIEEDYGVEATLIEGNALAEHGIGGGPFYGGVTLPIGFGLNPRKYIEGLAKDAEQAGARIFEATAVGAMKRNGRVWMLQCGAASVEAGEVIVATNGYSSEDVPPWLGGRFMPAQSTILVTRPLSQSELDAQGWTTNQMSYDSRNLLHYFRLMPDRRFLFGMRGAILTGPGAEARARAATRQHFERMFPEWSGIAASHSWSGLVSLAHDKLPYVGAVPAEPGLWTAMCYHGNGVAMGSYSGKLVAEMVMTGHAEACPSVMNRPLKKFPLGRLRRALMPPLYTTLRIADTRLATRIR